MLNWKTTSKLWLFTNFMLPCEVDLTQTTGYFFYFSSKRSSPVLPGAPEESYEIMNIIK